MIEQVVSKSKVLFFICLVSSLLATQTMQAQSNANETTSPSERTIAGTLANTEIPNQKLTPWDDGALNDWLLKYAMDFENDPKNSDIPKLSDEFRSIYGKESYYFKTTYDAIDVGFETDNQTDFGAAVYVLVKNCERYDPWACFNLSMLGWEDEPMITLPLDIHFMLFRRAADADYTLATHWLIRHEDAVPRLWSVDDQEVYLRKARDVDSDFAYAQLAYQLGDFYAIHHPQRADDGYFQRAIDVLNETGDQEYADYLVRLRE